VYAYVPNFVSIGLFCRSLAARNPNFCRFLDSAFCDVANWQQSEKVDHRCSYKPSPIKRYQNRFCTPTNAFMAKSGA